MCGSVKMMVPRLFWRYNYKRIVFYSNQPFAKDGLPEKQPEPQQNAARPGSEEVRKSILPPNYRFVYPEFLPDPNIIRRNTVREKIERLDMLDRRKHLDIPEFYVGSILAVTSSDPHAAGKVGRFVGICIHRDRCGLRARFILRNVIDHQGVEIHYEMYDPTIQKIEVLRLEKRLDDHLLYLRDALPDYSTFDMNMEAVPIDENGEVPVNEIKVILRPRPWLERWERQNLHGVANIDQYLTEKKRRTALEHKKPWEKYDLMKQYRATIPEEEQNDIFAEVHSELHNMELQRKKNKRKRTIVRPKELA